MAMGYVIGCLGGAALVVVIVWFIAVFGIIIGPVLWLLLVWAVIRMYRWLYRRVDPNLFHTE